MHIWKLNFSKHRQHTAASKLHKPGHCMLRSLFCCIRICSICSCCMCALCFLCFSCIWHARHKMVNIFSFRAMKQLSTKLEKGPHWASLKQTFQCSVTLQSWCSATFSNILMYKWRNCQCSKNIGYFFSFSKEVSKFPNPNVMQTKIQTTCSNNNK